MTPPDLPLLKRARVYHLHRGDVVVLETPQVVSADQLNRYADIASRVFAPAKVVVLEGGMTVRVLRPAPAEGTAP